MNRNAIAEVSLKQREVKRSEYCCYCCCGYTSPATRISKQQQQQQFGGR